MPTKKDRRIYFDYAASTPVDPRVLRAMQPYFSGSFGNPGSLHSFGQEAMAAVDSARETLAREIGADFREVVFTGSATEANNLALRGAVRAWRAQALRTGGTATAPRIIVSAIEHESVLEAAREIAKEEGAEVIEVGVDRDGRADPARVAAAIDGRTAVVSVMLANNEMGTIQPIAEIAAMLRAARKGASSGRLPLFHTDAVQAFPFLECGVQELGVDMMTLSAHKIYGPKGIGALFIKSGAFPEPVPFIAGGGQEFGMRSGTENVPLIAGFAEAVRITCAMRRKEAARLSALREYAIRGIKKTSKDSEVNGPGPRAGLALPHILNMYIPGILAEDLIMRCDLEGIAISSGSACRARAVAPSHVLAALGHPAERVRSSIRVSFGRRTTKSEIDRFLATLKLFLKTRRSR